MMDGQATGGQGDPGRNRLGWQCRRGMRELDEILMHFLARRYSSLGDMEQRAFARLLDYPDAVLLEILMGRMTPADREVASIARDIRNTFAA